MPSRASLGGQTKVLQPRVAETIGKVGGVGSMVTIAPLARVRCSCARGERPREGLAAAVAVEKRCRPRSPWTAPLPPWAVCPSSQGLTPPTSRRR